MESDTDKVLYIHGGGNTIGGVETYLAGFLKHHNKYKPYIGIVRFGQFYNYLQENGIENLLDLKGGRLRDIHRTIVAIYNAVKFVRENDIKLVAAHGIHAWVFAGIIAKISRTKSILFVHGDIREEHFGDIICSIGYRVIPDLYIANSDFTAKSIKKYIKKDSVVNYPCPDYNSFISLDCTESRESIIREFGIMKDSFIISMIGRIQRWKGQDIAIKAFKKLRNKHKSVLLIVGDITFKQDGDYFNYIKKMAQEENNIIFTGHRNDIARIISGSDLIVHTSVNPEPFGMVLIEAMLSRKTIIATTEGGPKEIIEDKVNGFLYDPGDFVRLAEIIDSLYENRQIMESISINGYNYSRSKFDLNSSVKILEGLYSKVIYSH